MPLHSPDDAIVLYQDEALLQNGLLEYAKSSIENGSAVIYLAGTRSPSQIEDWFASSGADLDLYRRAKKFALTTYDDIMLSSDGKIDLEQAIPKLTGIASERLTGDCDIQILSESNWWLMADVFLSGLVMEQGHSLVPQNMSVVCTYDLNDLLRYVSVYHIARLLELHRHSAMLLKHHLAISQSPEMFMRKIVLDAINDSALGWGRSKTPGNRYLSTTELIDGVRDKDDKAELESIVESRLRCLLNC